MGGWVGGWVGRSVNKQDTSRHVSAYKYGVCTLHLPPSPLAGGDDGSASVSTREESSSPTSLTSAGASSLQLLDDDRSSTDTAMEAECRELFSVMDDLLWQHSQVHA